ncbi:MAG: hypothetical protein ACOYMI_11200 [Phycisphaerales bacterium]
MDIIQDQIRELQTSVRRQRFAIVTLASILAGSALIGAVRPAGDAHFEKITCTQWIVVDKDSKPRIGASTVPDGGALMAWHDKDGTMRIVASTLANGSSGVAWYDKDGTMRIHSRTLDGTAGTVWYDKNNKVRVLTTTDGVGNAGVMVADKDGKGRIVASTQSDGMVLYPTKDAN